MANIFEYANKYANELDKMIVQDLKRVFWLTVSLKLNLLVPEQKYASD